MATQAKKPTCPNWQILLGEYALGTIDERDRSHLERHLARCRHCRRALAETEKIYDLLGDFELARPGPFFAAKVERALRNEIGIGPAEEVPRRRRLPLWDWLRSPAFVSAAAAASVVAVAAILYVKVWLPSTSKPASFALSEKVVSAPAAETAAGAKDTLVEKERDVREGVFRITPPPEARDVEAPRPPGFFEQPEGPSLREGVARRERYFAPGPVLTVAGGEVDGADSFAPFEEALARGRTGVGTARADEMEAEGGRSAEEVTAPEIALAEAESLTSEDVEVWMDARFEADVERLTDDTAVLLDLVTPDGSLMTYFYELPAEEQKMLLSRLREEAEAASSMEMLLSY